MSAGSVAVTGASGYLGSRIAEAMAADGWRVHRLSRAGADTVRFTLADGAPPGYFRDNRVSALVHCAWDFSLTRPAEIVERNVEGSVRVLEQAHAEGVGTLVFISTISAFPGCRSAYGKAKLAVEERAGRLGAIVVRPGLVYGDQAGGMVGALTAAARRLPVVPLIGGGRQVLYPAHEDDVTLLVRRLVAEPSLAKGEPIIAASDRGWTLRRIVDALAAARGRRIRTVPVPWRLIWLPLRAAELVGLRPSFRSDSVVSVVNQDPAPDFAPTHATAVPFRDFPAPRRSGPDVE